MFSHLLSSPEVLHLGDTLQIQGNGASSMANRTGALAEKALAFPRELLHRLHHLSSSLGAEVHELLRPGLQLPLQLHQLVRHDQVHVVVR